MRNFNEISRKDVTCDNSKNHSYPEDKFFEKPQGGGGKLTSPSCQYLNLPTFNQSSQSNQLFLDWLVTFLNSYVDCIG